MATAIFVVRWQTVINIDGRQNKALTADNVYTCRHLTNCLPMIYFGNTQTKKEKVMQIRQRTNKLVLLRSEYIPEKKRTVARQVASFDAVLDRLPEEVAEKLTHEERKEVRAWLDKRTKEREVDRQKNSLSLLIYSLQNSTKAIEEGNDIQLSRPGFADELVEELNNLKRALRKKGIKLTKPKQTKRKADDNQELDLSADN